MTIKKYRKAAFTHGDVGGNPAGVVIADEFPSDEEMLAIAADFVYSETAFAVRQNDESWHVRYFAPEQEVDFCGHATVALGATLGEEYGAQIYNLHINNGSISVEAREDGSATLVSLPTSYQDIDADLKKQVLDAFHLSAEHIDQDIGVHMVNAGNNHVFIPLSSRETLAAMDYEMEPMKALMREHNIVTIALAFRENAKTVHIRNAFAFGGVFEDPATGAAASAVSGFLRDRDLLEFSGDSAQLTYLQGDDMGAPSRLHAVINKDPEQGIAVSGSARTIIEP